MNNLPDPLTPPNCDLRSLPFMPLDVQQLRDSSLSAKASGEAFRAAVILWCVAWHQVPAGSLPNDDEELAHLCGYGHSIKKWKKIREFALKKFILCSDFRFYHPHISKKAMESWKKSGKWREVENSKTERQRRWRERAKHLSNLLREKGITPPRGASLETYERLLAEANSERCVDAVDACVDVYRVDAVDAVETCKRGNITEEEEEDSGPPPTPDGASHVRVREAADPVEVSDQLCRIAGVRNLEPAAIARHTDIVREWLSLPIDISDIEQIIIKSRDRSNTNISSLKYFDPAIRRKAAQMEHPPHAEHREETIDDIVDPLLRKYLQHRAQMEV